jgi:hypothetical protein
VDFVVERLFFVHAFQPVARVILCLEGAVIVCWLSKGQSVIEEKGEGFENGKILLACLA